MGGEWGSIQMGDDDAGERVVEVARFRDEREIRIAEVVLMAHVHAAVEHNPLPIDRHHHAAFSHLLPCA